MNQWEILIQGKRYTADTETIQQWIFENRIKKFDQVRRNVHDNWSSADKFPEFQEAFSRMISANLPPALQPSPEFTPPIFQPPQPTQAQYPAPYQPGGFQPQMPSRPLPVFAPPPVAPFPAPAQVRGPGTSGRPSPKTSMGIGTFLGISSGVVILVGMAVAAIAYFLPSKAGHGQKPMVVTNFCGAKGEITCAQITVPTGWINEKKLNKIAQIQVANRFQDSYAIIISEEKDLYSEHRPDKKLGELTLSEFADLTLQPFRNTNKDFKVISEQDTTVNGMNAHLKEVSFTSTSNGFRARMLFFVVGGRHHLHRLILWTSESRFNRQRTTLDGIANTFREVSQEDFKYRLLVVASTPTGPNQYFFVSNREPIRHNLGSAAVRQMAYGDTIELKVSDPVKQSFNGREFTFDREGLTGSGRFWSSETDSMFTVINLDDLPQQ